MRNLILTRLYVIPSLSLAILLLTTPVVASDILGRYLVNCDSGVDAGGYGPAPCFQVDIEDLFVIDSKTGKIMTQSSARGVAIPVTKDGFARTWLRILKEQKGEKKFSEFIENVVANPKEQMYIQIPEKEAYIARAKAQDSIIKDIQLRRSKNSWEPGALTTEQAQQLITEYQVNAGLNGAAIPNLEKTSGVKYQALNSRQITDLQKQNKNNTVVQTAKSNDRFLSLEEAILLCEYKKPTEKTGYRRITNTYTNKCPSVKQLEEDMRRASNGETKRQAALRLRAMTIIEMHSRSNTGANMLSEAFDRVAKYSAKTVEQIKTGLSERLTIENPDPQVVRSSPVTLDKEVLVEARADYKKNGYRESDIPKAESCSSFSETAQAASDALKAVTAN